MTTDLEIFISALVKIARENWLLILYIIFGIIVLARSEKCEKERMEKIIERDKLKRINNQKYSSSRY